MQYERSTYPKFLSNSSVFLLTMVSEFPIEVILLLAMFHLESRLLISILIIATKKKGSSRAFLLIMKEKEGRNFLHILLVCRAGNLKELVGSVSGIAFSRNSNEFHRGWVAIKPRYLLRLSKSGGRT